MLVSKLRPPPWRTHWVPRPRVLDRAAQAVGARLLLCAAPAGFGKTTALIGWAERRRAEGAVVAWYTLDSVDNDLARFGAYLLGAFAQADTALPLADLQRRAGADVEQLLVGLLNLLGAADRPYVFVLDDYHLIRTPTIHQIVTMLIERLPDNVQLVIGTRADPPLPLARLRVRGQLAELRAADLQFAPAEIAAFFLHRTGLRLSADVLVRLDAWTEGWAAGLQLLALALPHTLAEPAAMGLLSTLGTGSQRHIFAFLADEVLAQQTPEVQAFLLATSVVDDLTPELCDALRKDEGGRMKDEALAAGIGIVDPFILHPSSLFLEQLEQANLFLVRLDDARPWYRYHHLFRDFLRRHLDADQPGQRARLHRRAASWYAAAGEIAQAVQHALEGGDQSYAADLIVQIAWPQLSARGEITIILGWADRFVTERLAEWPRLCLYFGRAAFLAQQIARAGHYFSLAEQGIARAAPDNLLTDAMRASLLIYRASITALNGELGDATAWLEAAEPHLPPDSRTLCAAHAAALGACHYMRGDLPAAYATLARMDEAANHANHAYLAAATVQLLALVDLAAGKLAQADQRCTTLLARLGAELPAIPDIGLVLARLSAVAYQRGRMEQAELLLLQGAQLGRRSLGFADPQIWPWLVRVKAAQRDQASLRALLAEDAGASATDSGVVSTSLAMAARAEGLLALGALDDAWHWAQRCEQLPGEHLREIERIVIARVLLAQHRPAQAIQRLDPLVAAAATGDRAGHLIAGLVTQAQAFHDLGRLPEALAALGRALTLAAPEGYVQVFLDGGPVVATLLQRMKDEGGRMQPYIIQLLSACAPTALSAPDLHPAPFIPHPSASVEPFTERELDVLRLLAHGATNQDIATALVVTIGTVKTHLSHILGKLGARNRTEAVARARALGML